jgi:hypothetical protein
MSMPPGRREEPKSARAGGSEGREGDARGAPAPCVDLGWGVQHSAIVSVSACEVGFVRQGRQRCVHNGNNGNPADAVAHDTRRGQNAATLLHPQMPTRGLGRFSPVIREDL